MSNCEIFHITTAREAGKLFSKGEFHTESLARKGCIHCSLCHQVLPVLETIFYDYDELVILKISTKNLGQKLVYENRPDAKEMFPHIYGPVLVDDVLEVIPVTRNESGSWEGFEMHIKT